MPPEALAQRAIPEQLITESVVKTDSARYIEGQMIKLEPGDSWAVPKGAEHTYKILETFTAVEATSPPAQVHGRD